VVHLTECDQLRHQLKNSYVSKNWNYESQGRGSKLSLQQEF
jgi:hypothetical protein